jgi:hydroxymethylpyrimidine pyrophosphatase-like HAD family hydrolase/energy-coupling factor transporter ATP-binding protein EcfA2
MRYQLLASDYDGTLANQGLVSSEIMEKLRALQATGRKIVLVTGREMKDLVLVFPGYKVFDYIVAENGAVIHHPATGEEKLLGQSPGAEFVRELQRKGVHPLSVGKVIVATWVPHEQAVLDVIKASGSEYQVIFNKGAVMILPPGINKATGLLALLRQLQLSPHNCVGVGDAENDSSLLQAVEAAVAVSNALPALKGMADWVTPSGHGKGVSELIDALIDDDLSSLNERMTRHYPDLGTLPDGGVFTISPWRSGILVAGASGSGKTTLTISIMESLIRKEYQFCLIDPEGDYLELPGATIVGNEVSLPPMEEIGQLLRDPQQNLVICTLSVPLHDRPEFFFRLLDVLVELRRQYSRPHWLIMDEAHHLVPGPSGIAADRFPSDFNNFIVVSTSPHALHAAALSKIGMIISIGENAAYPFEQFGQLLHCEVPATIPKLAEGEICIWERDGSLSPFVVRYNRPHQLLQRHKKKYAQGDMGYNSFIFTGEEKRLHLVANNLMLFLHIAEGVDIDTWLYHLHRKDFTNWFRNTIHDEDLAKAGEEAEEMKDAVASRRHVLDLINQKYTA